ncbi:DNA/RNA polymerase [Hypoxylon sp. FL1284]|nr:DNA/RNA polymerase [Hypoxylon sp. FL1284]
MLVRPPPARRSLPLPRISSVNRPQLISRNPYTYYFRASSRIFTTSRPEVSPRPKRRNASQDTHGHIFQRSLATALSESPRQDGIPFPNTYMHPLPHSRLSDLRPFDPSAPLLLMAEDEPYPRSRINSVGVPGSVDEMLSVFDACLQVGKLDRATLVLLRLGEKPIIPGRELLALHNQYLRAAIDQAFEQPDSEWAPSLHKWYEVYIRGRGLPQNSETIACMLKVSLLSSQGEHLEHLVTRYMGMLPDDAIYQLLSETHILSQQDFGVISSIYQPVSQLLEEWEFPSEDEEAHEEAAPPEVDHLFEGKPEDDSPTVRPTEQKGLGLKSLRGVLSFFSKIKGVDISTLPLAERREIQSRLEKDCVDAAIARWREENQSLIKMGLNSMLSTGALNSQLYEWHRDLERKLQEEFDLFDESEMREKKHTEDQDRCLYAPFLRQSDPGRLAAVTIMSVLNAISSAGVDSGIQLSLLLAQLSKSVEDDIRHVVREKHMESKFNKKAPKRKSGQVASPDPLTTQAASPDPLTTEAAADVETKDNFVSAANYRIRSWPMTIRVKIGAILLSSLLNTAKMTVVREHPETKEIVSQRQPALAHNSIHRKGKRIGVIIPNKALVELLKREPRGDFLARHLPMLVEPEPWTKFDKGGFLQYPSQLLRIKNGEKAQRIYAEAAVDRGDMEQVSKGLDVLGRTAWKINQPVFDVILEAWNSGDQIGNIPPIDPQIPLPVEPEPSENPLERRRWIRAVKAVENEKSGLHSQRCFMNFQLEIANAFRDQTFYFPHNMDFRGRAYPMPTYLNHMGADHVRGMLVFASGKELGEAGLRWLKVHIANVFGFDKASLREREQFAMDHLSDITDSVVNPLTGGRWWLQAEDAWQCLAACFELKAALDSPDPTKYVSHLPVHQDGTCNGLQHYAALGGDIWGAQQVNLEPGDRPADVYSAVAELVKESVAEDVAEGNALAKAIDGRITRKVVKQTVMTNVYGVTFIGAKAQVLKQLDTAYPDFELETGVSPKLISSYITTKIFKALSTMFRGAHDIQYWLGECAGRICRALTPEQIDQLEKGDTMPTRRPNTNPRRVVKQMRKHDDILSRFRSTIVWTTPLRMPIVQPYRKAESRVIPTSMQDLNLTIPERTDPVDRRKQLQAFPPNFIHSLDASHMLLSALECDELGLSFAAVHDSFWTHAGDVDVMNRVLRDSFIKIHSDDVIGRLSSEFEARFKGAIYLTRIDKSSPAAAKINEWRKGARRGRFREELFEEAERQRLLMSSDPEEVQRGREMVTPASIFQEMSEPQPMSTAEEMETLGLGNIPDAGAAKAADAALKSALGGEDEDNNGLDADSEAGDVVEANSGPSEEEMEWRSKFGTSPFEAHVMGAVVGLSSLKARGKNKHLGEQVWLPLTFPSVPKKGDFDVTRLKESKYFFS